MDTESTPVTRVTLRYASAADARRLIQLAELEHTEPPMGAALVAEIDGRLRSHPIGIYLNQQKGRIADGLELVKAGKHCNSSRWVVRRAAPETVTTVVREDGI